MKTHCEALKPFDLSEDGVTAKPVAAGDLVQVPDAHVDGLVAEGYVMRVKAKPVIETRTIEAAPENRAVESAPEIKAAAARKTSGPKRK